MLPDSYLVFFAQRCIPPSPEAISECESVKDKSPEYVLALARLPIQLGYLESAVRKLGMLEDETGFVIRDWKQSAVDHIYLDKTDF